MNCLLVTWQNHEINQNNMVFWELLSVLQECFDNSWIIRKRENGLAWIYFLSAGYKKVDPETILVYPFYFLISSGLVYLNNP